VVVDCNGVGYLCLISLHTYEALKGHSQALLHTHLSIREDAHVLYGFATELERSWFLQLLAINGVGGSTALAILGSLSPPDLEAAIRTEDVNRIKAVKGVGPKTAARIVLELKGRLPSNLGDAPLHSDLTPLARMRSEALDALAALGFPRATMEKRIEDIMKTKDAPTTVEDLIKAALRSS
jgi:Holliday junction DNA helicase RuvA